MDYIQIDGNFGHGGGQILRSSLALSVVLNKPFVIHSIRKDRPKPGLRRQHLCGVNACAQICDAVVTGAFLGSTELSFTPGPVKAGNYDFEIGTGGSTTLVLQSVLMPLALQKAKSQVTVEGGTYCPMAPTGEFFVDTLVPRLNEIGYSLNAKLIRRSFYTAGSGKILVTCEAPKKFKFVDWTKRNPSAKCRIVIVSNQFPEKILLKIAKLIDRELQKSRDPIPYKLDMVEDSGIEDPGAAVIVRVEGQKWTTVLSEIAQYNYTSESLTANLGKQLRNLLATGVLVDPHLADQIILPLLFAEGGRFLTPKQTEHLKSCCHIVEMFTGQKIGQDKDGKQWLITVPKVNKNVG